MQLPDISPGKRGTLICDPLYESQAVDISCSKPWGRIVFQMKAYWTESNMLWKFSGKKISKQKWFPMNILDRKKTSSVLQH